MSINSRQIVVDTVCEIHTSKQFVLHFDDKELNRETFQVRQVKIIRETKNGEIVCQQVLDANGYYGFFDRPPLGHCVIPKSDISLIVYPDNVQFKSTSSLEFYRKDDKIQVLIDDLRKYEHGKLTPQVWRDALVLNTGIVPASQRQGNKHAAYSYVEVKVIRTYWKEENGKGEFYDKENIERFYNSSTVKFSNDNLIKI